MINAWSLLYEEYYGTMAKTYPIPTKEDDMSPCKLDTKITSLESDEYDPIITVGSGNTASSDSTNYFVDATNYSDIKIDTSALDNEEITISGGDTGVVDFDGLDFDMSQFTVTAEEPIVSSVNFDHITFIDPAVQHGELPTPGMDLYV